MKAKDKSTFTNDTTYAIKYKSNHQKFLSNSTHHLLSLLSLTTCISPIPIHSSV